jgi:hypothetical protein
MATSTRYNTLVARINQLESHLLPLVNTTGAYSDKDQDMIRSYCLLCHAETEAYLEDFTLEIVTKAYAKWILNKTIISPIIFHLAYSYNNKSKELPYSMIVQSYSNLKKTIEGNNGIKENNLIGFFRPIGFEIDPTLKAILNNFGKTRGQIAHTSFQTQQSLDPATEKSNLNLILQGLKTFDEELNNYENSGVINRTPVTMQWDKYGFVNRLKILFTGKI